LPTDSAEEADFIAAAAASVSGLGRTHFQERLWAGIDLIGPDRLLISGLKEVSVTSMDAVVNP
jgi:hypothetical protein